MTAAWQCTRCFALHFAGERVCRRCGAPRPGLSVPAVAPRAPASLAFHLQLPPTDFASTRRGQERGLLGPIVLLLAAVLVAGAWDPVARRVAAASALGGTSPEAITTRTRELRAATDELRRLLETRGAGNPDTWRAEVRAVGPRWGLNGDAGAGPLGALEVRVRSAWLVLVTLPHDAGATGPHVSHAREALSRASEDLSHVP